MTLKQALNIIERQGRNLKRFGKGQEKLGKKSKWYCNNHKKVHKYTFHSVIVFCPGTERMFGADTIKEVKEIAWDLLRLDMKRRLYQLSQFK